MPETLEGARAAYARRDWVSARAAYDAASRDAALEPDDAYAAANCAWWLGDLSQALPGFQEAHRRYLEQGRHGPAALVALDTAYTYMLRGEGSQASGWMQRAVRLLDDLPESVEHGYLLHIEFESAFAAGDLDAAAAQAQRVEQMGVRFADPTLSALGALGRGRVLVRQGHVERGMALLDEAMVAAVSDNLDPGWAGNIYCHLMIACYEIADLRRAGEWTDVTARWCESMPGAGPFMGICRVHRAQLLQVRGAWDEADRELERVCDDLADFAVEVVAEAIYHRGELRRLRGDLAGAQAAYEQAHRLGRDPQPGMALVALARGRVDVAAAAIRGALTRAEHDPLARAPLLPAAVEIAVAARDLPAAAAGADELEELAATYRTPGFRAVAATARGLTLLAGDDPAGAVAVLREALEAWRRQQAPLESAQVRLLLAQAHEALGDVQTAGLEREAALAEHTRLGVRRPARQPVPVITRALPDGLTPREVEVLGLVADGRSNQEIADHLVLSVRTVERHLATVYQKLGLRGRSARAAAVGYALRHSLAGPDRRAGSTATTPPT